MEIIRNALNNGRFTLSESESKIILESYNIPVTREIEVSDHHDLAKAVGKIGFPLVMKACSHNINHKTELGLVRLDIRNEQEANEAFCELAGKIQGNGGSVLVQEMVKGAREFAAGFMRDVQFGPCVMFGLGGIFMEITRDVSFRTAPLNSRHALDMIHEIHAKKILNATRGMPPVDVGQISEILLNLARLGLEQKLISEIDINPLIVSESKVIAVDALIILDREGRLEKQTWPI